MSEETGTLDAEATENASLDNEYTEDNYAEDNASEEAAEDAGEEEDVSYDKVDEEEDSEEEPGEESTENEEAPAEPKMKTLKVNGVEVEMSEAEIEANAQKYLAADNKFQEAARTRDQVVDLLTKMKEKPFEVLKDLGVDVKTKAEDFMYDLIQKEQMSPEERKILEMQEENKSLKDAEERRREQVRQMETEKQAEVWREKYDREISAGLQESKLPKTANVVSRVARYIADSLKIGEAITVPESIKLVEEDLGVEAKSIFEEMPEEKLAELLGDKVLRKVQKYSVKGNSPNNNNIITKNGKVSVKKPGSRKKMTFKEAMNEIYSAAKT